jgi:hypothetical protein
MCGEESGCRAGLSCLPGFRAMRIVRDPKAPAAELVCREACEVATGLDNQQPAVGVQRVLGYGD